MLSISNSCACCLCLRTKMFLLLIFLCLMKTVRTYKMFRGKFSCLTEFYNDQSDFESDDLPFLKPEGAMSIQEWIDSHDQYHLIVAAPPSFSPSIIHGELSHFLQTLKQMYDL